MSDVSKTSELIAEAREFLAGESAQYYDSSLIKALVDALEVSEKRRAAVLRMYDEVAEARQVDEAALADVIRNLRFNDAGCWDGAIDCNRSVTDHAEHIARAVVEFLGERHEPGTPARDQLAKLIYEGHPDSMYSWDELDSRGKIWPLRAAGAILAAGFSRAAVYRREETE